jgi:hypothetical protein
MLVANSHAGEFDFSILESHFAATNWSGLGLESLAADLEKFVLGDLEDGEGTEGDNTKGTPTQEEDTENPYTTKIEAPIYEPKNEKPLIEDLFDNKRYGQIIEDIEKSDLPKEEKDFLKIAAQRHIVFNYEKIADFYAHSAKETQTLMEDSALVIIDFNRAIELGYVRLSEEVATQYLQDYKNDTEDGE